MLSVQQNLANVPSALVIAFRSRRGATLQKRVCTWFTAAMLSLLPAPRSRPAEAESKYPHPLLARAMTKACRTPKYSPPPEQQARLYANTFGRRG